MNTLDSTPPRSANPSTSPGSTPEQAIHDQVRDAYAKVVAPTTTGQTGAAAAAAHALGYSEDDTRGVGKDANLGLSCGNPHAIAALAEGETVLDLGSGAGFDALIAAPKLGSTGRFIGVDMTPEMLERARTNAVNAGYARTVEFREGLIEALPVASHSVDVVISNCVINLCPDKDQVFREIFRVLKPGGRIAISDIVLDRALPEELRQNTDAWNACLGGAIPEEAYMAAITRAGFVDLTHTRVGAGCLLQSYANDPLAQQLITSVEPAILAKVIKSVFSYAIRAVKP